jgi:hypothetical protein
LSGANGRPRNRRRRPYRDSAVAYAVLGLVVIVVALLTGGGAARAVIVGAIAFVLATCWTWWRLRSRGGAQRR